MADTLLTFAFWLRETPISVAIRVQPWLWPASEIIHFVGLSLLVGVAGFFDLRLLGLLKKTVPLKAAHDLIPWAKFGFALCAVTGVTFFLGAPDQYVNNAAFYPKLLFLVIALANAQFFETAYGRKIADVPLGVDAPRAYKTIAATSLTAWFMVMYWGRMLPFIGNAF